MAEPLKVVTAEDNYLVREGTRRLLEDSGEFKVLACVEDADALLDAVREFSPDAVLTDIRMPPTHRTEGIEAALRIKEAYPAVGVVILSQHVDQSYALELFKNGTAGLAYLLKERLLDVDELHRAIREVAAGRSVVDPQVVELLILRNRQESPRALSALTTRELQVLSLMAEGRTNGAIASELHLSLGGVEKHATAIFSKLGVGEEPQVHRRVAAVLAFLNGAVGSTD